MKMFCIETVIIVTFGHAIIFVKPRGVASSTEIMRTIGFLKRKNPAACGAFEIFVSIGFAVPQPDVERKLLVEPGFQVGFLLYLHPCLVEQGEGLVFLLLSSEVVHWFLFLIVGQAGLEPAPTSDLSSRMGAHSSHYATLPVVEACAGVEPAFPRCHGVLPDGRTGLKFYSVDSFVGSHQSGM